MSPAEKNSEVSTEPVTFTYFGFGANKDTMASDTTIGKKLQEQTGVDWKNGIRSWRWKHQVRCYDCRRRLS
ncbi:hypothetical protein ACFTAO_19675 [Paenibacillus rhizoplanae]